MYEIRIHGRGGQGAKALAQILAEAAILDDKEGRAFPEYGPERSGAPVASFVRISEEPIKTYEPVITPDAVLVLDETLAGAVDFLEGLSNDKILIINTALSNENLREKLNFQGKIVAINAKKISFEEIGENRPNIPILGAFIKAAKDIIDPKNIEKSIKDIFLKKIGEEKTEKNIKAFKKAYDQVS